HPWHAHATAARTASRQAAGIAGDARQADAAAAMSKPKNPAEPAGRLTPWRPRPHSPLPSRGPGQRAAGPLALYLVTPANGSPRGPVRKTEEGRSPSAG